MALEDRDEKQAAPYPNDRDCVHGSLRRSCDRCEDAARIAELEAARDDALEQASDFAMQDEARRARIAELEAECSEKTRNLVIQLNRTDKLETQLASAREAGAREFAEWCVDEESQGLWYRPHLMGMLARFLASGTGDAGKKDGGE